jgi:hypothetical protein
MARAAEAALAAEVVRQRRAERRVLREQRRRERAAARARRPAGPATLRQVLHLPWGAPRPRHEV